MDGEVGGDEKWQADEEARRAKIGATADPWDDDKVRTFEGKIAYSRVLSFGGRGRYRE